MARTITTRAAKGTPLSHDEQDANTTGLDTDLTAAENAISTNAGDIADRLPLAGGTMIGDLVISKALPSFTLDQSDGTSTHRQTRFIISTDDFQIQTRDDTGTFVSIDYIIHHAASGGIDHEWRVGNTAVMMLDAANGLQIDFIGGFTANGGPQLKSSRETTVVLGNAGATETLNFADGNVQTFTVDEALTVSFSNFPASPVTGVMLVQITNGGAFAITWPAAVEWNGGVAPTLAAADVDIVTFITTDGGTVVRGMHSWSPT